MSQVKEAAACIVTVDMRDGANVYRASAKWAVVGKIMARASCTSGPLHAAIRCAAKMFGLTNPSIVQLEAEIVLQEVAGYEKGRPGFRQWIAALKGPPQSGGMTKPE